MKIKNRSDTFTWSMLTRLCAPFLLELLVFKEIQRSICVVLTLNTYKSDHNPYNSLFTFYFLKYIINGLHQLQNYGKSAFDAGPQNPVKKKLMYYLKSFAYILVKQRLDLKSISSVRTVWVCYLRYHIAQHQKHWPGPPPAPAPVSHSLSWGPPSF